MDSEPFAPLYREYRKRLAATSNAERLGELACVIKPKGRYSTLYVADEQYGLKLLSGRQIAQYRPIALKVMSRSAWERPEDYQLAENTVVLTADGRAEENLADCALIRSDRDGWAASGHVHRLVPNPKTHPGLLYLACSSKPVQKVLKAMATGSVIDALSDTDIAEVVVPFPRNDRGRALGDAAVQAWDNFAEAWRVENEAILELEGEFSH